MLRKYAETHDCNECMTNKMEKLDKTLEYVDKRVKHQAGAREKFENVLQNVKRKLINQNKKIDMHLYNENP